MIKNIGKELRNRRKNKQAYPCYLLFAFSVYFLFSYFLPFSYSYGKGHLQDISGFSMFTFRQAEGYLARTANRRLISYVAAGLILFVSVLAVLSKREIKKRANILLVLLFLDFLYLDGFHFWVSPTVVGNHITIVLHGI